MLEWVESDGVKLAVEVVGTGEPVSVAAHGLTGTRAHLATLAPFVPGTKVLFDFRGHGESERPPPGSYSMDDFAADIDNVARAYGATSMVGISLGGGAALRLLTRNPERFEKLVVLLPARFDDERPASVRARRRLLVIADILEQHPPEDAAERILALEDADGIYDGFTGSREVRRDGILAMNDDGIPHAIREAVDDAPVRDPAALEAVSARSLVVGQENDPLHAASVARDLAATLPEAELLVYPTPRELIEHIPEVVARIGALLAS